MEEEERPLDLMIPWENEEEEELVLPELRPKITEISRRKNTNEIWNRIHKQITLTANDGKIMRIHEREKARTERMDGNVVGSHRHFHHPSFVLHGS